MAQCVFLKSQTADFDRCQTQNLLTTGPSLSKGVKTIGACYKGVIAVVATVLPQDKEGILPVVTEGAWLM